MLRSLPSWVVVSLVSSALAGCAADSGVPSAGNAGGSSVDAVRVCAAGTTVQGIDVSVYQGSIDWNAVAASGIGFAIARVGDGLGHDTTFATNWAGIKAAGIVRGAYQFFRPQHDAAAQADLMIAAVGSLGPGDLPPILDVEIADGVSGAAIAAGVQTWVARVAAATGRTPMIYTGYYFWRDTVQSTSPTDSPLWIAAYSTSCPSVPAPWTNWTFFQYADHGNVPGVSGTGLDMDRFNGTLADLQALAAGAASSTPPPAPTGVCTPGATQGCYDGASGTEGVGICRAGTQTCDATGNWPTSCAGEQTPAASELCGNGLDDNCNGQVDEGCSTPTPTPTPTSDPCAAATDCASCTAMSTCGWCGSGGGCLSGSGTGPTNGACGGTDWAWYSSSCP